MAQRAITITTNNVNRLQGNTAVALAPSDTTDAVLVSRVSTAVAIATTASFGTGNITLTAQGSLDGTNWVTLGTATTITADGNAYNLGSATTSQDVRNYTFIRWIRGADSNVGTVSVSFRASNS